MTLLSQAAEAISSSTNNFWWAQPGATLIGGLLVFSAAWVAYSAQSKTREQEREHHKERLAEERKARTELVAAQREEWQARVAQDGDHHRERIEQERLARMEQRTSQLDEWKARLSHERTIHLDRLREETKARMELLEAQREEWEARIVHERMEARRTEAIRTYMSILELAAFCKNFADGGFVEVPDEDMPKVADLPLIPVLCPPGIAAGLDALEASTERMDVQGVDAAYESLRETVREHLKTFDASPRRDLERAAEGP